MKSSPVAVLFVAVGTMAIAGPASASDVEFRLVVDCAPGQTHYPSPFSDKRPICVASDVIMNDANIVQVKPKYDKYVGGVVEFEFDAAAQGKLTEVTESHPGGQLALLSKGKLISAAMINSPIRGRDMELTLPDKDRQVVLRLFQDRKIVK